MEPPVGLPDDPMFNPTWEEQFLFRTPPPVAEKLRKMIKTGNFSKVSFNWTDERKGTMMLDGREYNMRVLDLACVLETQKTLDKVTYFKTGDVGQIVIVTGVVGKKGAKGIPDNDLWHSGVTPPTKDIRKRKFKKPKLYNFGDVETEVLRLMKGGQSEDVQYQLVDPSEVAHMPEFSEETFDYDPANPPETPFTPDTPFTPGDTPFTPADDPMEVDEPQTPAVAMTPMHGKRRPTNASATESAAPAPPAQQQSVPAVNAAASKKAIEAAAIRATELRAAKAAEDQAIAGLTEKIGQRRARLEQLANNPVMARRFESMITSLEDEVKQHEEKGQKIMDELRQLAELT